MHWYYWYDYDEIFSSYCYHDFYDYDDDYYYSYYYSDYYSYYYDDDYYYSNH